MDPTDQLKVKVAVRIRPLLGREKGEPHCVFCEPGEDDSTGTIRIGTKTFTFDYVFPVETIQSTMFDQVALPLVDMSFNGYNASMLAYGQTGSGKTFTMGTGNIVGILAEQVGLIPRVAQKMFEYVQLAEGKRVFSLRASFVELYNEEVKDLFDPVPKHIAVREDKQEGIVLVGATEKAINSFEEMMSLLELGSLSRTTHSTNMNEVSSRSHAIFTCRIEQHDVKPQEGAVGEGGAGGGEDVVESDMMTSKFHFVDLAGSERIKRTGAEGDRMKEGISINSGLLALGNVISALGDPSKKAQHVPYRDSRLTRLLQDSLGGNSRTVMIACVSPAESSFNETLNTLRYANRARNIKNHAVINRDPTTVLIANLRKEVAVLRSQLREIRGEEPPSALELDTGVSSAKVVELERQLANERKHNAQLKEQLMIVCRERDCFAMKLKATAEQGDTNGEELLAKIKDEFMPLVSESAPSLPILSVQVASPTISHAKPGGISAADKQALKTKIAMMKSLMNRKQQQQLARMEATTQTSRSSIPDFVPPTDDETQSMDTDGVSNVGTDSDPFDNSDMLEEEQIQHRLQVKLLDDQFSALSSGIDAKNQVIKNYKDKTDRYDDMAAQYAQDLKTAHRDIAVTQRKIVEVNQKMELADLDAEAREAFVQEKAELEKQLDEMNKRLHKVESERHKLEAIKSQSDRKIQALEGEVKMMKEQKVALSRKIKDEKAAWTKFKQDQKKEMIRLRLDLKTATNKYAKLEAEMASKQAAAAATAATMASPDAVPAISSSDSRRSIRGRTLKLDATSKRNSVGLTLPTSLVKEIPNSPSSRSRTSPGGKRSTSSDTRASVVPAFLKWMQTGIDDLVDERLLEQELMDQEDNCRMLEEKMRLLKKAFDEKREQGFQVQLEFEDKLENIKAELEYRRQKILETKQQLMGGEIPFDFDSMTALDASTIARIVLNELIEHKMEIIDLKTELEEVCEDLGQTQSALMQLEARIPLQELKMQQYKAELDAEHEKQLWFFMNQIEGLKQNVRLYEQRRQAATKANAAEAAKAKAANSDADRNNDNDGAQATGDDTATNDVAVDERALAEDAEQQQIWAAMYEIERLREQRYEDLLERNTNLARLVAEQAHVGVQYREATTALQRAERMVGDLLGMVDSLSHAIVNLRAQDPQEIAATRHRERDSQKMQTAGKSIFERLSNADTFTGMYKVINDDMRERGVGHLGGAKVEKKRRKPKRDAPSDLLVKTGVLKGHHSAVYKIKTTDQHALTASMDSTIKQWDVAMQKELLSLEEHKGPVRTLELLDNNVLVSTSEDKTIRTWDLRIGKCISSITLDAIAFSLNASQDKSCFFTGHDDGCIFRWTPQMILSKEHHAPARLHTGSVVAMTICGEYLASGSRDRTVKLFDPVEMACHKTLIHHHDSITTLAIVDGHLVSGSRDRQIKLYNQDEDTGKGGTFLFNAHSDWVNVIVGSPNNKYFFSGSKDSTIKVWDATTWEIRAHDFTHDHAVHDLAWFKDGLLLSASHDSKCFLHALREK